MGEESSERQRVAPRRQSLPDICCGSSNNTKQVEENMKQLHEDQQWPETLAELQRTLLVESRSLEDEISQQKRRFGWKHIKRLKQLKKERDRVSELIKRNEQLLLKSEGPSSACSTVKNQSAGGLELPTREGFFISSSVKRAAFEIMEAIEDDDVGLIGLVGLPGVGKTTLAKLVARRAQKSRLFDHFLMIDSHSRQRFEPDRGKMWDQIKMVLPGEIEEDSTESMILGLRRKLQHGKKMLIILDDVWWKEPNLEALGIPYGECCKVLVTTCLPQVCSSFGCQITIQLKGLTTSEAGGWYNIEGLSDERYRSKKFTQLHNIHIPSYFEHWEEIVGLGASEGLPFAMLTTPDFVRHLEVLHDPIRAFVTCINEYIFHYLKLYYDYLGDRDAQFFFILCSHFPQDYCATSEELTRYAYGGIKKSFEGSGSIQEARRKIHGLISVLQSYSLLLEGDDRNSFKMADFFRRLAHWLAGYNTNGFIELFPSISTACVRNKPLKDILLLGDLKLADVERLTIFTREEDNDLITYPLSFLSSMQSLRVLFLLDCSSTVEARPCLSLVGLHLLMNLQTLQLRGYKLMDLYFLGKLSNLEILCFISCDVDELPDVLGELCSLKLLELSSVKLPASVTLDWIGQLSKLEELHMTDASIEVPDMNSSTNLKVKHLYLNGTKGCRNLFPDLNKQGLNQLEVLKLDKCDGLECLIYQTESEATQSVGKPIAIEATNEIKPITGFSNLTYLELLNLDSLYCLWGGKARISLEKLKVLIVRVCQGLEYLFSTSVVEGIKQLEILHIFNCPNLKSIFMEDPADVNSICMPKLTSVRIEFCAQLQHVFPVSMVEDLQQLTELEMHCCDHVQHVFFMNGEEASNELQPRAFVLPELKCLKLIAVDKLKSIKPGADILEAPLEELVVDRCEKLDPFVVTPKKDDRPRLKRLLLRGFKGFSPYREEEISALREKSASLSRFMVIDSSELFDHPGDLYLSALKHLTLGSDLRLTVLWRDRSQAMGMQNLTRLEIKKLWYLRYIFTPSSVRNIPHLKYLRIDTCYRLESIIEADQPSGPITTETRTQYRPIYFPNLTEIEIIWCNKLTSVFPIGFAQFPKLKRFIVDCAHSLKHIFTDEASAEAKYHPDSELKLPVLTELSLVGLPSLVCFAPVPYRFTFPCLNSLTIEGCPQSDTKFVPDQWNQSVYTETEALSHLTPGSSNSTSTNRAQPSIPLPQFSGEDYDLWHVQMKTYLLSQDLWEIVRSGIHGSSLPEDKKRDVQALSIIHQALTKPLCRKIIGEKSAKQAWDALQREYQGDIEASNDMHWSPPGRNGPFASYRELDILEKNLFTDESTFLDVMKNAI